VIILDKENIKILNGIIEILDAMNDRIKRLERISDLSVDSQYADISDVKSQISKLIKK
jgi:hypothetical protein